MHACMHCRKPAPAPTRKRPLPVIMAQVQTLVELRAIQLEAAGKMSRYGPLIALELLK